MAQCITILPDAVASQIAAGESIERPASVAKELLENALDAGARTIALEVAGAGQQLLRLSDDGCGMCRDDALLAFERHATSKIRSAADLERLGSLGFRGEALPSIAAVARVLLETAEAGAAEGTSVCVEEGVLRQVRSVGRPPGTTVTVRDLFRSVPGRRKFLKAPQTEQQHVHAVVTQAALAQPQVALRLACGRRQLLALPGVPDLAARLRQLFGDSFAAALVPFALRQGPLEVGGFAGRPQLHRARRSIQYLFVNGRPVRNAILSSALREAYARFLPEDRHPVAFLFVRLDPAYVDVNVHPTKQEVRFHRNDLVADTVRRALEAALRGEPRPRRAPGPGRPLQRWLPPAADGAALGGAAVSHGEPAPAAAGEWAPPAAAAFTPAAPTAAAPAPAGEPAPAAEAAEGMSRGTVLPFRRLPDAAAARAVGSGASGAGAGSGAPRGGWRGQPRHQAARQRQCAAAQAALPREALLAHEAQAFLPGLRTELPRLADLEPLGQFAEVFILAAGADALYIIDQHVAHERILYETLQQRLAAGSVEQQRLLFPNSFELAPAAAAVAAAHLATLARLGFEVECFGGRSFLLRAVPALLAAVDGVAVLGDVLDELAAEERAPSLAALVDDVLAMMACRAAVKANTRLGREEQRALLARLDRTATPHRCPHGRPVLLTLEVAAVKRWFLRG
ncbi:MAG: DNA mismatch repair endonuclease MutL [Candidatus Tectomicrobia bacterium]|nr:DNA mismatch repair endonuclease MutL [Candidatus Tectomicrobia bacterium]